MTPILQDPNQATDRRKYIGGSDAPVILGLSPWRTPYQLYQDKITPPVENSSKRRILQRGHALEPYVLGILAREESLEITGVNNRYRDGEHDFIACEIDAEFHDTETNAVQNIEIKTSMFGNKAWGDEYTDSIPVYYQAQAMHGLMVTGRQVCVFGVLIGIDDFRVYHIQRDDEIIAGMRQQEVEFWQRIIDQNPPEATTPDDILKMYPKDDGSTIELTGDMLNNYNALIHAKAMIKQYSAEAEAAENALKLTMNQATALTLDGKPLVTWKAQSTNRFDTAAFKESNPELYEQFKKTTDTRVFRVK